MSQTTFAETDLNANDIGETEENFNFNRRQTMIEGASTIDMENDGTNHLESPIKQKNKFATVDPELLGKETDETICRICLCEEEPGNPIITPC